MFDYLIDYENVGVSGLDGIGKLTEEDSICIFYSEKADHMTFGMHRRLNEAKAKIIFQKIDTGTKNALDFQLSSYLGYLICQNKDKERIYYIITKDKGFCSLTNYWKKKGISVRIASNLTLESQTVETNEPEKRDELVERLGKVFSDKEVILTVAQLIRQYDDGKDIHNALQKEYKNSNKAKEVYKAIKPIIEEKKKRKETVK